MVARWKRNLYTRIEPPSRHLPCRSIWCCFRKASPHFVYRNKWKICRTGKSADFHSRKTRIIYLHFPKRRLPASISLRHIGKNDPANHSGRMGSPFGRNRSDRKILIYHLYRSISSGSEFIPGNPLKRKTGKTDSCKRRTHPPDEQIGTIYDRPLQ